MTQLIDFLSNNISEKMSLEAIVDVFEEMCTISLDDSEEELILVEVGNFSINHEQCCVLSLVRQYPNEEEEFYQVHVDISYASDEHNQQFAETIWDEDLDESIFDYIKQTEWFQYLKNIQYLEVKIFVDET